MNSRLSDGDAFRFASRLTGFAVAVAITLIFTGITQAQLKPAPVDSTAVRPAVTAYAEIPAGAQSVVSATLGKADEAYRAKSSGQGYAIENPANHLAAQYAAGGVNIRLQNATLGLEFQGWGSGKADVKQDQAAVTPHVDGNRVEYRRGALTEWYVNGPLGIEQGFTISQPPVASPDSQPGALDIALRLGGTLSASVEPGRHALTLRDQKGVETLRYGTLLAYDASGRELESWMEVQDGSLRLRVNTAGARYPILVDPFVQAVELSSPAGATGNFSRSVAVSGNTVVVGAPQATVNGNATQGAAYVFVEPAGGWATASTYTAELYNDLGSAGDGFGWSVGIGGNTIVVSAIYATVNGHATQGAAYVFVEPTVGGVPTWTTPTATPPTPSYNAKLTEAAGNALDSFGWSVAINESGNVVVVGDPFANSNEGAAYVFVEPTNGLGVVTWTSETENAKLIDAKGLADKIGWSVGINESGTTVVAGAPFTFATANEDQGAAYVYVAPNVNDPTSWVTPAGPTPYNAQLTASDGQAFDFFGESVGISGNTVVVGAPQATIPPPPATGGNAFQGAAYVFVEPTTGVWANTSVFNAKLTASDGAAVDNFGWSVGISGNTVVAAAVDNNANQGAAYVFVEPTTGVWATPTTTPSFSDKLIASDGAAGDAFGYAVGISGSTIVVGSENDTVTSGEYQGAAYVFTQPCGAGPCATYSTPAVNFGNVDVNVPTTMDVTVTNTGNEPLTIQAAPSSTAAVFTVLLPPTCFIGGAPSSPSTYPFALSTNDYCTYGVQFDPTTPGTVPPGQLLEFLDNAGVGQSNLPSTASGSYFEQSVPLSGTGVAPASITTTTTISTTSTYEGNTLPLNTALVGDPITVSYTVTPTSDDPTGPVNVTDGFGETCSTPSTLIAANAGVGSCVLTINQLGAGTTSLMATYTPDGSSPALLPSTSNTITENIVELVAPCGANVPAQATSQYGTVTYSWTVCLRRDKTSVQAFVPYQCMLRGSCHVTVTSLGNNLYSVAVKIYVSCGDCVIKTFGKQSPAKWLLWLAAGPGSWSWPLPLLGFGALLGMLMLLQVVRQTQSRPRLLPAAGILAAIMLSGLSGCSNSRGVTPVGTYTINVTLTAAPSR